MEDKKLLWGEVIKRWAGFMSINTHILACFLADNLPCFSFSKFAWCNRDLANPPASSTDLWHGKNRKWRVKYIENNLGDLYLLESDVLKYESDPKTIIGERQREWKRNWERKRNFQAWTDGGKNRICRELDTAKEKDPRGSFEKPLANFLRQRKERYDNHLDSASIPALFEAAYAIHYVTVMCEHPLKGYEPPAWILKGLKQGSDKYRLYPDDAKFEWLDSQELKYKWHVDDSRLARLIWNNGLKWYALSLPNTGLPTPDWILEVSDGDVDFNGWKWLFSGKITLKTILFNVDKMIFSLEEVEQFEKDHPELRLGRETEKVRALRGYDNPAEQSRAQDILSRLSPEDHKLLGQIYSEAKKLYLVLKKIGLNGHSLDPERKWKDAVLKYFEVNPKEFTITERKDLDDISLYRLNPGQSKRDFISKSCSNVFNRKTGMDIGARPLYEFLKKSVN